MANVFEFAHATFLLDWDTRRKVWRLQWDLAGLSDRVSGTCIIESHAPVDGPEMVRMAMLLKAELESRLF